MRRLTVMTWNILHKTWCEEEAEHPWRARRDGARRLLEKVRPDVFCAQEAFPDQMDDLLEDLPDYWWFGLDRHGDTTGEGCPIAYDTKRWRPLERGQFWLGAEPDRPGSLTWVNDVPRIVTWARFEAHETGERFYLANTHFDHLVPTSRTKAVELLKSRLPPGTRQEPVILAGDFNTPAWMKPYRIITRGEDAFTDTYKVAERGEGPLAGTYHHFTGKGLFRVDWILTRPRLPVPRLTILRDTPGGLFPSDHFPVVAELLLVRGRAQGGEAEGARRHAPASEVTGALRRATPVSKPPLARTDANKV